jgi:adenine deaminase
VIENQLITKETIEKAYIVDGKAVSDSKHDILKLVVVNRYNSAPPAIGFVKNMGILSGAIASTVAHDSHNIICVGSDDYSITRAINLLVDCKGGLSLVDHSDLSEPIYEVLPLSIAGLMSHHDAFEVTEKYKSIDALAKQLGTNLKAPYMTLSFLALLVIPELKLSDKGLFTSTTFNFTDVFVE